MIVRMVLLSMALFGGGALFGEPIKHSNGVVAFDNCKGYDCRSGIFHSNKRVAFDNCKGYDCRSGLFHSNGRVAFDNCSGYDCRSTVYHFNGQVAWDGNTCYHSNGSVLRNGCNGVNVSLGEGISLSVRSDGNRSYLADLDVYGFRIVVKN